VAEPLHPDVPDRTATGVLLVSTAARLSRLYGKALGQLEVSLTFRQHRLLLRVAQGHRSLAALAAFGNLTLPTVSESVEVLVRRELLRRDRNPEDRRVMLLALTPLGQAANQAAEAALAQVNEALLADISADARVVLHESLQSVFSTATSYFQDDVAPGADRIAPARDGRGKAGPRTDAPLSGPLAKPGRNPANRPRSTSSHTLRNRESREDER